MAGHNNSVERPTGVTGLAEANPRFHRGSASLGGSLDVIGSAMKSVGGRPLGDLIAEAVEDLSAFSIPLYQQATTAARRYTDPVSL
jgi:hypothetical protein